MLRILAGKGWVPLDQNKGLELIPQIRQAESCWAEIKSSNPTGRVVMGWDWDLIPRAHAQGPGGVGLGFNPQTPWAGSWWAGIGI